MSELMLLGRVCSPLVDIQKYAYLVSFIFTLNSFVYQFNRLAMTDITSYEHVLVTEVNVLGPESAL